MKNNRKIFYLFLVSWLVTMASAFLFVSVKADNARLGSALFENRQKLESFKADMANYARLKEAQANWDKNMLDYTQWQYVLKDEISVSKLKILAEINKIKDLNKNNQLAGLLYNNLGLAYTMSLDFDSAIKAFEQSIALDPLISANYYELGLLHSSFRVNKSKAVYYYKKFLEVDPKSAKAEDVKQRVKSLQE